jgi:trans-2,3-dihydro-3-hydroxyanthranilate isomerase
MRLSETSFIQTPTAAGADYRNRIWTVTREVPFAGHPSVGAAVAVAKARGDQVARYVQQTPAGLQPVDVRIEGASAFASVLQEPATFGPELAPEEVMRAIGLDAAAADRSCPPQFVTTGLDTLLVPVAEVDSMARTLPNFERIARLSELADFNTYVVALDRRAGAARARMFNGNTPGGEDPATGSAAGPLCAYLHEREGWDRVEVLQGVEIGRPSRLVAEVEGDRVRVGGGVVVIVEGSVYL